MMSPPRCVPLLLAVLLLGAAGCDPSASEQGPSPAQARSQVPGAAPAGPAIPSVHYLEIVTPSVDETCDALARAHGLAFGEPVAQLGDPRTDVNADGRLDLFDIVSYFEAFVAGC